MFYLLKKNIALSRDTSHISSSVSTLLQYVNATGVLSLRIGNQNMQKVGTGRF